MMLAQFESASILLCLMFVPCLDKALTHFLSKVRKVLSFFEQSADYEVLGRL